MHFNCMGSIKRLQRHFSFLIYEKFPESAKVLFNSVLRTKPISNARLFYELMASCEKNTGKLKFRTNFLKNQFFFYFLKFKKLTLKSVEANFVSNASFFSNLSIKNYS